LSAAHRRSIVAIIAATAVVLGLTASAQLFDSNFYAMSGAVSLLSGDRIYRDFFEPGVPLAAYTAAAAQMISGYRLIAEFIRQWVFIIAGFAIAAHLGLRLSRSASATLMMMAAALLILASTPSYHYDKLFFFPLIVWASWRYIDRPTVARAVTCGCITAIAFLFRHDYGVYLGAASVGAFVLGRVVPADRSSGAMARETAACATGLLIVLAPWLIAVQTSEGLVSYSWSRAQLFQGQPGFAYQSLLHINPIRTFTPPSLPAAKAAAVVVTWDDTVDDARRQQLERDYALRFIARDERGRWRYQLPNVYDMRLLELEPYVNDTEGLPWDLLHDVRRKLPVRENVIVWVQQMALLVPLALIVCGAWNRWFNRSQPDQGGSEPRLLLLAGGFLLVVDVALLRQASYVVMVMPLTAALAARFLTSRSIAVRILVGALTVVTMIATLFWMRGGPLYQSPSDLARSVRGAFAQLVAMPPDNGNLSFRYLRECTASGDHVLVVGGTPLDVSYYAHRPIAGGQINWHYGWRSDPAHEAESLALLQRQSVPIALSTEDPVLENFKSYPRIRAYLAKYYAPVDGTDGFMMVDTRRRPTGTFGPAGFPCFR
jgi:hypothetical protein